MATASFRWMNFSNRECEFALAVIVKLRSTYWKTRASWNTTCDCKNWSALCLVRPLIDANAVSALASRLFECATANGAASLNAPGGTLEPGRAADFFTVDLDDPSIAGASHDDLLANCRLFAVANRGARCGGRWQDELLRTADTPNRKRSWKDSKRCRRSCGDKSLRKKLWR